MTTDAIRIAYLTAGAAGMYCGACLHDNTLAAALTRLGVDIQLIPTYTPIRTDEQNVSVDRVFFGGINVYLQQKSGLFRWLPAVLDRFLDQPWLLRWATARSSAIDPKIPGRSSGVDVARRTRLPAQRGAAAVPIPGLRRPAKPGRIDQHVDRRLHSRTETHAPPPVLVTLQGDDAFLEYLPEPHKTRLGDSPLGERRRWVLGPQPLLRRVHGGLLRHPTGQAAHRAIGDRYPRLCRGRTPGNTQLPRRTTRDPQPSATWHDWPRKKDCTY